MLSSIFIALLQAVAGDPATTTAAETPAAETPAQTEAAPRTERVRVCRTYEATTGGRLSQRRCRWEERPVRDEGAGEAGETAPADETSDAGAHHHSGGTPAAASPSAPSPQ